MKFLLFVSVFCSAIALDVSALAQSDGSDFLTEVSLASTNNIVVGRMNDIAMQETLRPRNVSGLNTHPVTASYAATQFKPNKSQTRANLQSLGRRLGASNPAIVVQAEQLFAKNDIIGAVGGVMDQFGLKRNNVAHAYALYWVVYWGLANKVYDAPSPAAMQAVAAQAERGFAANADFAAMNNAQKQAAAEELMALTAIMDASSEQAKSDPAFAAQLATASLEGSRKSGLDLDKMTLTENGFVPAKPRKRTGSR